MLPPPAARSPCPERREKSGGRRGGGREGGRGGEERGGGEEGRQGGGREEVGDGACAPRVVTPGLCRTGRAVYGRLGST